MVSRKLTCLPEQNSRIFIGLKKYIASKKKIFIYGIQSKITRTCKKSQEKAIHNEEQNLSKLTQNIGRVFFLCFVLFCSVTQSCLTLCDPTDYSIPGLPVPHHLLEFVQVHVHCIGDAIQPSHPLTPSYPFALNLSWHQGLFQ